MTLTNATLTQVRGPGAVDRSGQRTGEGAIVWSGRRAAYLRRTSKMATVNGNLNKIEFDQLVLQGHVPTAINPGSQANGSIITIVDSRDTPAVTRKFRVVEVTKSAVGSRADSVRIELAEERV